MAEEMKKVNTMSLLEVRNLQKIYHSQFSASEVEALRDVSFAIEQGEFTAIMGESGSGKTTLLNILATLDQPTLGSVWLEGKDMSRITGHALSSFRRNHLGFIFQDYNLLDTFTNKDNILLPLVLNREKYPNMLPKLENISRLLELEGLLEKYPYEISGGQKQRVAAARALITEPELLLADEPTGALDSRNSQELLSLFSRLNAAGQTIVMVTHSIQAASYASRVLFIKDGEIFHQIYRGERRQEEFFQIISDTLSLMAGSKRD